MFAASRSWAATPLDGLSVAKDGAAVPLASLMPEGPAILHFWATWCLPCRDELPTLAEFAERLRRNGDDNALVIVSVDSAPYERVRSFIEVDLGLSGFESWRVVDGNPGSGFGLFGYPATVLIGADGSVAQKLIGPVNWSDDAMRSRMLEHIAGG